MEEQENLLRSDVGTSGPGAIFLVLIVVPSDPSLVLIGTEVVTTDDVNASQQEGKFQECSSKVAQVNA